MGRSDGTARPSACSVKLVVLDFDGVLNSKQFWVRRLVRNPFWKLAERAQKDLDPEAIGHLNRVIRETGAKVVVSSTWRKGRTVEELQQILDRNGFVGEVVGKTPSLCWADDGRRLWRGDEIQAWLDQHPEVDSFAIVDDDSDMSHLMHRLVLTRWNKGLKTGHADLLIRLLNDPLQSGPHAGRKPHGSEDPKPDAPAR